MTTRSHVQLNDNATNYIEFSIDFTQMQVRQDHFTAGWIPVIELTTVNGEIIDELTVPHFSWIGSPILKRKRRKP